MSTKERIELAKVALKHQRTRGQFIRENAAPDADRANLQDWSDAFTDAMSDALVEALERHDQFFDTRMSLEGALIDAEQYRPD